MADEFWKERAASRRGGRRLGQTHAGMDRFVGRRILRRRKKESAGPARQGSVESRDFHKTLTNRIDVRSPIHEPGECGSLLVL
jgi:hypothetical protein